MAPLLRVSSFHYLRSVGAIVWTVNAPQDHLHQKLGLSRALLDRGRTLKGQRTWWTPRPSSSHCPQLPPCRQVLLPSWTPHRRGQWSRLCTEASGTGSGKPSLDSNTETIWLQGQKANTENASTKESALSFTAAFVLPSGHIRLDFLVRKMSLHPSGPLNPVKGLALVNSPVARWIASGWTDTEMFPSTVTYWKIRSQYTLLLLATLELNHKWSSAYSGRKPCKNCSLRDLHLLESLKNASDTDQPSFFFLLFHPSQKPGVMWKPSCKHEAKGNWS